MFWIIVYDIYYKILSTYRNKVECAGFCLSYNSKCFAFQFKKKDPGFSCILAKKSEEICVNEKEISGISGSEIYVSEKETIYPCPSA